MHHEPHLGSGRLHQLTAPNSRVAIYDRDGGPLSNQQTTDYRESSRARNVFMKTKPKVREMRSNTSSITARCATGKYYGRLLNVASNVVVLESDVAKAFPTSASLSTMQLRLTCCRPLPRSSDPAITGNPYTQVTLGMALRVGFAGFSPQEPTLCALLDEPSAGVCFRHERQSS